MNGTSLRGQALVRNRSRTGFTIVELLIVIVIGAILLVGAYQVLIAQQRVHTAQSAQVVSQQIVRDGLDVLFAELREAGGSDGDILTIGVDSIRIRAMRKFGIVCAVNYAAPPVVTVRSVGDVFEAGDSVFLFADNRITSGNDDEWLIGPIGTVDTTAVCGGGSAQQIQLPAFAAAMAIDSVRVGGPMRSFTTIKYGTGQYGGHWYVGRQEDGGSFTPLIGPIHGPRDRGLQFTYFDDTGNTTAVAADVHRIGITIRAGGGGARSVDGSFIGDSIHATTFVRN